MQLRFFKIPVAPDDELVGELNGFLRSRRVTQILRELVADADGAYWAICVEYLESAPASAGERNRSRIDYREILGEATFEVFARLRAWRKQRAEAEGIPVYAILTNEQLAEIARRRPASKAALAEIEGIGDARIEKYGAELLTTASAKKKNEADGKSDRADRGPG